MLDRKLISSFFDNGFVVSVIFQAEMPNIPWFQLLSEDFLLSFVTYDSRLNHLWALDCLSDKTSNLKMSPWTLQNYNFSLFSDIL